MRTIIVKLQGGLGNQMFQYSIGRSIANDTNSGLILDLSFLNKKGDLGYTLRDYELDVFGIDAVKQQKQRYFGHSIFSRINTKISRIRYVGEKSFRYDPAIFSLKGNLYLDGFWQTEKYFQQNEELIRQHLSFKAEPDDDNRRLAHLIENMPAVSLHIRRGDYVNGDVPTYHNLCTLDYYHMAIKRILTVEKNPTFFIFSDDICWTKQNLNLKFPHHFVENNTRNNHYWDMYLMSLCKHNIIANSSFSWWGAWLNKSKQKLVIAPQKWFNDPKIDTSDIVPSKWIRI